MSACPRPGGRRDPQRWSGGPPCRPLPLCALVGAARALSGVRGRRGGARLRQRCGWEWEHTRAGSTAQAGGWCRGPTTRGQGAAWASGALSCAMSGLASAALRGGLGLAAAGRAAGSPVPQQGEASAEGPGGVKRPPARGPAPRPSPGSTAYRGGAASCGQGGARGVAAGGHRETHAPASVSSHPTWACRRPPTAFARASLRLLAAPEAER